MLRFLWELYNQLWFASDSIFLGKIARLGDSSEWSEFLPSGFFCASNFISNNASSMARTLQINWMSFWTRLSSFDSGRGRLFSCSMVAKRLSFSVFDDFKGKACRSSWRKNQGDLIYRRIIIKLNVIIFARILRKCFTVIEIIVSFITKSRQQQWIKLMDEQFSYFWQKNRFASSKSVP